MYINILLEHKEKKKMNFIKNLKFLILFKIKKNKILN